MNQELLDYKVSRSVYSKTVALGFKLSQSFHGEKGDLKKSICSTLFLKLILNSISILRLTPNIENDKGIFDISSIAGLVRSLIENSNILFYFCFDKIKNEELEFRIDLSRLHTNIELKKMLTSFGQKEEDFVSINKENQNSKDRIRQNNFFANLPNKQGSEILKGRNGFFLTHKEITLERKIDLDVFNGVFKFLSSHLHSLPYSINQIQNNLMTGVGNKSEYHLSQLMIMHSNFYLSTSLIELLEYQPQKKQLLSKEDIVYIENKIETYTKG